MQCRIKQPNTVNNAVTKPCCLGCSATSTWSTVGLLLLLCFMSTAEAGLLGLGSGDAAPRGGGRRSVDSNGGDMDKVFAKFQQESFWAEVQNAGMEVMEEEVAEKKRKEIFIQVAKACSIGAQMTLIMGGGALLFRLLPILLGHELEDEEEAEAASPYLLQPDGSRDRPQQALPAAAGEEYQRLLTNKHEELEEDAAAVRLEGQAEGVGGAGGEEGGWAEVGGEGGAVVKSEERRGAVVAAGGGQGEEWGGDGEVVVETPWRTGLGRARRLSRPFLRAMLPPLALLLAARLALAKLMVKRIDPTLELLFGDDIIDLYSVNRKKVLEKVDMPFPKDADDVPGRKKMKGKGVQRPPRPEGEGEGKDGGRRTKRRGV